MAGLQTAYYLLCVVASAPGYTRVHIYIGTEQIQIHLYKYMCTNTFCTHHILEPEKTISTFLEKKRHLLLLHIFSDYIL